MRKIQIKLKRYLSITLSIVAQIVFVDSIIDIIIYILAALF